LQNKIKKKNSQKEQYKIYNVKNYNIFILKLNEIKIF